MDSIEKQMRQAKQLADRQRQDDNRRIREQKKMENRKALQLRAASIVSGSRIVSGFRVMDTTSELVLRKLLESGKEHVGFTSTIFPEGVQNYIGLEFEKLLQYGMISQPLLWMGGGEVDLLPPAFSYFQEKEKAEEKEASNQKNTVINYGNYINGDITNSQITLSNSIAHLEQEIDRMVAKIQKTYVKLQKR